MSEIASLIDKATSSLLLDIDWETTLQIVDMIRQGDISAKILVYNILPKIHDSNPNVVILALKVLECIMKNCGQPIHEEVANWDFMAEIRELMKKTSNDDVQKKVLHLLATWAYVFRSEPKYRSVQDTVNILKAEGHEIPTVVESDAMFTADSAPDWADGECCHRCRSQFTMIRRKHHCRACGQVFCSDCSSKTSTIPKFGIERDVRVCEHCYDEINNRPAKLTATTTAAAAKNETSGGKTDLNVSKSSPSSVTTAAGAAGGGGDKRTAEEIREEEELQLALALSKSEAENKEKEKLRVTSDLLAGGWRQNQSNKPVNVVVSSSTDYSSCPSSSVLRPFEKNESDPELAKYLNRSFWEQREKQRVASSESSLDSMNQTNSSSSSIRIQPSAPINASKVIAVTKENFQNGVEEVDDFVSTLRGQLEIFINRMRSNQSRGRPIANDTSVQSLFMNITAMHSQLLTCIQDQDRKRVHFEQLQDRISQIRDARAALDALREEHRERLRREKEEQERTRQMQMMQKLEIMRKKKQEYLEYQRQMAIHRMAESERQIMTGQQQSANLPGGPPQLGAGFPPTAVAAAGVYGQGFQQNQMVPAFSLGGAVNPPPSAAPVMPPFQPQGVPLPPNFHPPSHPQPEYGGGHYPLPGGAVASAQMIPPSYGPANGGGMPLPPESHQGGHPAPTPAPQVSMPVCPKTEEDAPLISFD